MNASEPDRTPADQRASRRLSIIAILAATTALALMIGFVVATALKDGPAGRSLPTATTSATATPTAASGTSPASSNPQPSPTRPSPTPTAPQRVFRYQALWPFGSEQEASGWQRAYRAGGSQPWHLDPAQTALSFTTSFLGFDEVNTVVARTVRGDDATVSVGYRTDSPTLSIAAVIHLRRIGQGGDAPWEVVGTRDTTLTLDRPGYGAWATSPLKTGGRITGVDEAIRVEVRQISSKDPLGSYCCVAAGGKHSPWSAAVPFRSATSQTVIVIASTGGHYQSVEQFAVTAVRPRDR